MTNHLFTALSRVCQIFQKGKYKGILLHGFETFNTFEDITANSNQETFNRDATENKYIQTLNSLMHGHSTHYSVFAYENISI